jgi:hypothetical protein
VNPNKANSLGRQKAPLRSAPFHASDPQCYVVDSDGRIKLYLKSLNMKLSSIFRFIFDLFPKSKKIEMQYTTMLQQYIHIPKWQAKEIAKSIIKQAQKNLSTNGYLPKNYGDYLLKNESADDSIKDFLAKKRAEGVRDEDIIWLWNMDNLEREVLGEWDGYNIAVMYSKFIEEDGLSKEEALKRVKKARPIYGTGLPEEKNKDMLPFELKNRVSNYTVKRGMVDPEQLKKEINDAVTCNDFIRQEIKKGNI